MNSTRPPGLMPRRPSRRAYRDTSADSLFGTQLKLDSLVLAPDHALEVDAPDVLVLLREADLVEGDAQLDRPARAVDGGLGLPDAVPGVVFADIVRERHVGDRSGRVGIEGVAGALVEVGIDRDHEPVGVGLRVAAAEALADLRRLGVAAERGDVEGVVVVGDPDVGRLGRGGAVVRIVLGEAGRGGGGLPDGFIEAAVEGDGLGGADGLDGLDGGGGRLGRRAGRRGPVRRERERKGRGAGRRRRRSGNRSRTLARGRGRDRGRDRIERAAYRLAWISSFAPIKAFCAGRPVEVPEFPNASRYTHTYAPAGPNVAPGAEERDISMFSGPKTAKMPGLFHIFRC